MKQANAFLRRWVPRIRRSPAFRDRGLLIVTFDEAEGGDEPDDDGSACCNEPTGPNTPHPGALTGGPGGGRIGAVLLSPCIRPGPSTARRPTTTTRCCARSRTSSACRTSATPARRGSTRSARTSSTGGSCGERIRLRVRPRHPTAGSPSPTGFGCRRCRRTASPGCESVSPASRFAPVPEAAPRSRYASTRPAAIARLPGRRGAGAAVRACASARNRRARRVGFRPERDAQAHRGGGGCDGGDPRARAERGRRGHLHDLRHRAHRQRRQRRQHHRPGLRHRGHLDRGGRRLHLHRRRLRGRFRDPRRDDGDDDVGLLGVTTAAGFTNSVSRQPHRHRRRRGRPARLERALAQLPLRRRRHRQALRSRGNDSMSGGRGADLVKGNGGADYIKGKAGGDDLAGGKGIDFILGGTGRDAISGGKRIDCLRGGAGDDLIQSGAGPGQRRRRPRQRSDRRGAAPGRHLLRGAAAPPPPSDPGAISPRWTSGSARRC